MKVEEKDNSDDKIFQVKSKSLVTTDKFAQGTDYLLNLTEHKDGKITVQLASGGDPIVYQNKEEHDLSWKQVQVINEEGQAEFVLIIRYDRGMPAIKTTNSGIQTADIIMMLEMTKLSIIAKLA